MGAALITAGEHTFVPDDISCFGGVDVTIGKYCSIGSGLKIYSGEHACIKYPEVVSTFAFKEVMDLDYPPCKGDGFVIIGNDVWIATDVRILEGVRIGSGAIIGAGTLVTKDVPPYAFVAGNPGEEKRRRFSHEVLNKLLKIKWWDWPEEVIKERVVEMKNVWDFVEKYG